MSDQPTQPQPQHREPRRLLRTRNDRVIAGVAGGLGRYFGIDPVIVRIAFAVSVLIGGLGVLAYVALALFVPTAPAEDGEVGPPPVERSRMVAVGAGIAIVVIALSLGIFDGPFWGWHGFFLGPGVLLVALVAGAIVVARAAEGKRSFRPRGVLSTVIIAIGAFFGLGAVAVAAAWAGATGHGVAVAIVIIAIGVLLAAAAFSGGARWLIAPALALAIPLGAVSAADISFGDGVGNRDYRPLTAASIPPAGYELGIGRLAVDLRSLDWQPNSVVDLNVDLGVGQALVAVPSNVCVTTDFRTRAGDITVAGDNSGGFDVRSDANAGAAATPRLNLTGEVDLGELRVINSDTYDLDEHFHGFHQDRDRMAADLIAACERPSTTPGGGQHG